MAKQHIRVYTELSPKKGAAAAANRIYSDWSAFLKEHSECLGTELVCCDEHKVAWFEHWPGRKVLNSFTQAHLAYSDLLHDAYACSRGVPKREMLKESH